MRCSLPLQDFLTAARGERPEHIPTALIVDSPWLPGFVGMNTLDFFLDTGAWLEAYLAVLKRFPDVVFLPGFWVEYGMANEPSAYGARVAWSGDAPPGMHPLPLPVEQWGELPNRAIDEALPVLSPSWSTVIVDEAQDLDLDDWALIEKLAEGRRLWAFHDPAQSFWEDRAVFAELFTSHFRLARGYRCPEPLLRVAAAYVAFAWLVTE